MCVTKISSEQNMDIRAALVLAKRHTPRPHLTSSNYCVVADDAEQLKLIDTK